MIMEDHERFIIFWFLGILVLSALFEVGLLLYAWINADRVSCNLLWCEFTTERMNSTFTQDCFRNGERINCSDIVWRGD